MKNLHHSFFGALACLMFVTVLWSMPPATDNPQPVATAQTPASQ